MDARPKQIRVLAVSSGGGHWSELRRLRPSWAEAAVSYAVTEADYRKELAAEAADTGTACPDFYVVTDANATNKIRLIFSALTVLRVVLRVRPDVVISTGAAPGYFAIRFGKMMGARTIWVDSIANAEELSVSGKLARKHSDLWLTQWPHLADQTGAAYAGTVL
ncbi:Oligosaccharide biosynthesis protein Alg14 like protein [Tritonibacter multivorans]|uniref:Oligosaccharide biosynthesis protein Alg14 like protein n=1 Tax=Tritonibacter multivorans TaxID=928856 RepID=A0A0P1GW47_9RHOB|nr:hypothetical protein [Tritonibacter multivorans]MDA7422766.1 UDP-N-acetylglucosamine--LPS N-acetylglucosamine transferase [Tritonibacter multivorans]CUH80850.1 Oligosaccharide biosynthesis protein Alg14 like protein [Tritonibacter multivorans]SFD56557.1 Oligosaccharide biosynthesis protein Alg14 like [Tritonibacter multivorans]